jgi:hypothetical protein
MADIKRGAALASELQCSAENDRSTSGALIKKRSAVQGSAQFALTDYLPVMTAAAGLAVFVRLRYPDSCGPSGWVSLVNAG